MAAKEHLSVNGLTHTNQAGEARMVDVSEKYGTLRIAVAEALVTMQASTLDLVLDGNMPKGDVLAVARVAGIQAAKKTSDLIPLCHPLPLTQVEISFDRTDATTLTVQSTCKVVGPTGVEMEALTAAAVSSLTIYDMCKAVEKGIRIDGLKLLSKSGGKSGKWVHDSA